MHYTYFNLFRYMYVQADNVIAYVFLIPTIVSGRITLGIMNQILRAFGQVASSFQFLVSSWTTIIELISIYKRLQAFEAAIADLPMPTIDRGVYRSRPNRKMKSRISTKTNLFQKKCESGITSNKSGRVFDPLLIVKRLDRIILPTPTHITNH